MSSWVVTASPVAVGAPLAGPRGTGVGVGVGEGGAVGEPPRA